MTGTTIPLGSLTRISIIGLYLIYDLSPYLIIFVKPLWCLRALNVTFAADLIEAYFQELFLRILGIGLICVCRSAKWQNAKVAKWATSGCRQGIPTLNFLGINSPPQPPPSV